MAILETRGLRKVYGSGDTEVRALDGVDLTVEKGEFAAVVGTSGSGKSTLLHNLRCLPNLLRNQPLMYAIYQQVVLLLHKTVIVPSAVNLLCPPPSVGNFSAVNRIPQNQSNQVRVK